MDAGESNRSAPVKGRFVESPRTRLNRHMTSPLIVRRTSQGDWREYRDLRLEMLADTPEAFGETLENVRRLDESEWRKRSARGEATDQILLAAIDRSSDRWVGSMGGLVARGPDVTGALLVGVYVSPAFRGQSLGAASAMLVEVEEWAGTVDTRLKLHVHENNARARAFYERSGYRLTGVSQAYAL